MAVGRGCAAGLMCRDDNAISYLTGIPCGVRSLYAAGNRLTALASVDHLRNLQFLDVSRNQLESVARESSQSDYDACQQGTTDEHISPDLSTCAN